jgi:hypothetical protein
MSKIEYIGDHKLTDNELTLFNMLFSILYYSDPEYRIKLVKKDNEIIGHIFPSVPDKKQALVDNLLHINRTKKLRIRYSSSLAISKTISFRIPFDNLNNLVSL